MFDIFTGALGAQLFARGGKRAVIDIYAQARPVRWTLFRVLVLCAGGLFDALRRVSERGVRPRLRHDRG